jgi:uncharacterized protein (TIGR02271 family)
MTYTQNNDYGSWIGQDLLEETGARIGRIGQIYLDERTGQPTWATVRTGLFGTANSFVPLSGVQYQAGDLISSWDKATIKGAPHVEDDGDGYLTYEDEGTLYRYYGLDGQGPASPMGTRPEGLAGQDRTGPTADSAMMRSEEQVTVGTARQEAGRVRLRKYVVTEQVQTTVPVSHEEFRIEREPIRDANMDAAVAGAEISEEEHEVVLSEERPVVQKEVVPVERVRLSKDTVTEEAAVNETVRKERIEVEDEGTAEETALGQP